jgi:hypothetical protein
MKDWDGMGQVSLYLCEHESMICHCQSVLATAGCALNKLVMVIKMVKALKLGLRRNALLTKYKT